MIFFGGSVQFSAGSSSLDLACVGCRFLHIGFVLFSRIFPSFFSCLVKRSGSGGSSRCEVGEAALPSRH